MRLVLALAVLVATLAGCAIVPIGPPFIVGIHARGDHGYGDGYHRGGGYYR